VQDFLASAEGDAPSGQRLLGPLPCPTDPPLGIAAPQNLLVLVEDLLGHELLDAPNGDQRLRRGEQRSGLRQETLGELNGLLGNRSQVSDGIERHQPLTATPLGIICANLTARNLDVTAVHFVRRRARVNRPL
jgi:hypothetical protein